MKKLMLLLKSISEMFSACKADIIPLQTLFTNGTHELLDSAILMIKSLKQLTFEEKDQCQKLNKTGLSLIKQFLKPTNEAITDHL